MTTDPQEDQAMSDPDIINAPVVKAATEQLVANGADPKVRVVTLQENDSMNLLLEVYLVGARDSAYSMLCAAVEESGGNPADYRDWLNASVNEFITAVESSPLDIENARDGVRAAVARYHTRNPAL